MCDPNCYILFYYKRLKYQRILTWQQNRAKRPEDLKPAQHHISMPERKEVSEVREDQPSGANDAEP